MTMLRYSPAVHAPRAARFVHTHDVDNSVAWQPRSDVSELDDAYEVSVELPGIDRENVNVSFEDGGAHGLQNSRLGHVVQSADIGGQHSVCGAVAALGLEAFKNALFGINDVDPDIRLSGEFLQDGPDQERLPVRIKIYLAVCRPGRSRPRNGQ